MTESERTPAPHLERPSDGTILLRAARLRCPRCGQGHLFTGLFRMHRCCRHCGLTFLREPGYYLGSIYINYGLTALIVTFSYVIGRFALNVPTQYLVWPLVLFCLVFPILIFRHARAFWLALDCRMDHSVLGEHPHTEDSTPRQE